MSIEELKRELAELLNEEEYLQTTIDMYEETIKESRKRLQELRGHAYKPGLIGQMRAKYKYELRLRDDQSLPKVYFVGQENPSDYVFDKKTAKRIFIRRRGEEKQMQYNADGTPLSKWRGPAIDLARTGIEAL